MKTRAGEVTALANLPASVRARLLPVMHVCKDVAPRFGPALVGAWSGYPIALDGTFNANHTSNALAFTALLTILRNGGIPAIPSVSMASPNVYLHAAFPAIDSNGLVVKSGAANIAATHSWMAQCGLPANMTDFVIDLQHIGGFDTLTFAGYVSALIQQNATLLGSFRSVTLASGAAPKDHTNLAYGANIVPRTDWDLWQAVRSTVPGPLDYGDYLTGHPDLTEPPGAAMKSATVSARYTLDAHWLIIKGRATGGAYGQPMATQHQAHANAIVGTAGFNSLPACWGDSEIQAAAANIQNRSGRQKWTEYAANRHISLVADRLP